MNKIIGTLKNEFTHLDTTDKQLRKFGFLVGGTILLIVGFLGLKGNDAGNWLPIAGIFFVGGALVFPRILLAFYYAWMGIAIILGFFLGNLLLGILFYILVTPISLLMRLFRKKDNSQKDSYWITRTKGWSKETMERLF